MSKIELPPSEIIMDDVVRVYSDGSVPLGNPGPGGWAALLVYRYYQHTLYGYVPHATNNQMEMQGVIEALNHLKFPCKVVVYTDSKYVQKGMSEWLPGWLRRKWLTSSGHPVKNKEMWIELLKAQKRHISVNYRWIKGHNGHPENEYVDRVACRVVMEKKGLAK